MKINEKVFSLPPYISTSWGNVAALHMKDAALIVSLVDGDNIEIPGLSSELLEKIFNTHANFIEQNSGPESSQAFSIFPFRHMQEEAGNIELPLKFGIGAIDAWGAALQHNPSQANMPNLPEEVLDKVRSISKILSPGDSINIPLPEPHCNCMHCQIARAINQGLGNQDLYLKEEGPKEKEIEVTDEDLGFQQWKIQQNEEKLYTVTNKLDEKEKYSVYLGHPVGCTCGKQGCEHILAVLKS